MHSGTLILLWLAGVASIQFVSPGTLLGLTTALGVAATVYSGARSARLLRRVRFLLLAIIVVFSAFTPGEALLDFWPELSPSREGVALALVHAGRVICVVFCVSMLMRALPTHRLVGGLYALLRPFDAIGFPTERVAVRILLVLDYVDSEGVKDWKRWLLDGGEERVSAIPVSREALGWVEVIAIGLAAGALGVGLTL